MKYATRQEMSRNIKMEPFDIYDANDDSGKKYGDFYVDKDNGKIYKRNTKTEKLEEYKK